MKALATGAVLIFGANEMFTVDSLWRFAVSMPALAVLAWYCWFVTAKAMPKIRADYLQETNSMRAHNQDVTDKVIAKWDAAMQMHHEDNKAATEAVVGLTVEIAKRNGIRAQ